MVKYECRYTPFIPSVIFTVLAKYECRYTPSIHMVLIFVPKTYIDNIVYPWVYVIYTYSFFVSLKMSVDISQFSCSDQEAPKAVN